MPEIGDITVMDNTRSKNSMEQEELDHNDMGTGEYVCPICKYRSNDKHCFHYGGVSCYSCRAFFRRAHQGTKSPNFKCKNNEDCEISVKTRRKCQKCRYELCRKSGMDPQLVLDDNQKKVRFRNYLKKKATQRVPPSHESTGSSRSSPEYASDYSDESLNRSNMGSMPVVVQPQSYLDELPRAHVFGHLKSEASYMPVLAIMNQVKKNITTEQESNVSLSLGYEEQYMESLNAHNTVLQPRDVELRMNQSIVVEHQKRRAPQVAGYPESSKRPKMMYSPTSSEMGTDMSNKSVSPTLYSPKMSNHGEYTSSSSTCSSPPIKTEQQLEEEPSCPSPQQQPQQLSLVEECSKDRQVEKIQQHYFLAMAQRFISATFLDTIQSFHHGKYDNLDVLDFYGHLFRLTNQFQQFASQQSEFEKLSNRDQALLLRKNTTLFLLYILAQYIGAKSGEEQLRWILDENLPQNLSVAKIDQTSFRTINKHLKIVNPESETMFEACVQEVNSCGLDYHFTSLVINLILFNNDIGMNLEDSTMVSANFIEALELLKHGHLQLGISIPTAKVLLVIKSLEQMCSLLIKNSTWSSSTEPNLPLLRIPIPITKDELEWTEQEFQWFDYSWSQERVQEEVINDMVQFTLGTPMPSSFYSDVIKLFLHRTRNIVLNQPEFKSLPIDAQNNFWRRNCLSCLAVCLLKLESAPNGFEQMKLLVGELDPNNDDWMRLVPHIDPRRLKRVSIMEVERSIGRLGSEDILDFMSLSNQTFDILQNNVNFKLLNNIMLFDGEESFMDSRMSTIQDTYNKLLQRRLHTPDPTSGQTFSVDDIIKVIVKASFIIPKLEN